MAAHPALAGWESFYVIIGSSGAALIGLQFVVMTLIADIRSRATPGAISAFGTPTVVHLAGSLLIAAIMSVPWPSPIAVSIALAACGVLGIGYGAAVVYLARHQTAYAPVWEDWLWHVALPCCAYATLAIAALFVGESARLPLFVIASAALGLLLIAIHNAWDTLTYIVFVETKERRSTGE